MHIGHRELGILTRAIGKTRSDMFFHHRGGQHVEQRLVVIVGDLGIVEAGAHGPPVVIGIVHTDPVYPDIVPAKTPAGILAQRIRQQRSVSRGQGISKRIKELISRWSFVGYRVHTAVENTPHIGGKRQFGGEVNGNATTKGGWNIEIALLCKQSGVVVKLIHVDF